MSTATEDQTRPQDSITEVTLQPASGNGEQAIQDQPTSINSHQR